VFEHNVFFCPDGFNSGESVAHSELRQLRPTSLCI